MRKRTKSRECALQLLYAVDITGSALDEIMPRYWEEHPDDADVKSFAAQLARGTLEHREEIDTLIRRHADNWRLERMAVIDRNIIRMTSFELLHIDDIPPKVSINEAVDLAKKFGDEESGRFVNGVLDKINKTECQKKSE